MHVIKKDKSVCGGACLKMSLHTQYRQNELNIISNSLSAKVAPPSLQNPPPSVETASVGDGAGTEVRQTAGKEKEDTMATGTRQVAIHYVIQDMINFSDYQRQT